jgi:hypothetical protein
MLAGVAAEWPPKIETCSPENFPRRSEVFHGIAGTGLGHETPLPCTGPEDLKQFGSVSSMTPSVASGGTCFVDGAADCPPGTTTSRHGLGGSHCAYSLRCTAATSSFFETCANLCGKARFACSIMHGWTGGQRNASRSSSSSIINNLEAPRPFSTRFRSITPHIVLSSCPDRFRVVRVGVLRDFIAGGMRRPRCV